MAVFWEPAGSIIDRVNNRLSASQRHLNSEKVDKKLINFKSKIESLINPSDLKLNAAYKAAIHLSNRPLSAFHL